MNGELRLFLSTDIRTDKPRYEAMLFCRIGRPYNFESHNLLGEQDASKPTSPFVYGSSLNAVLNESVKRLNLAIKRGVSIDCSKYL